MTAARDCPTQRAGAQFFGTSLFKVLTQASDDQNLHVLAFQTEIPTAFVVRIPSERNFPAGIGRVEKLAHSSRLIFLRKRGLGSLFIS
jgi:hypothetical protein